MFTRIESHATVPAGSSPGPWSTARPGGAPCIRRGDTARAWRRSSSRAQISHECTSPGPPVCACGHQSAWPGGSLSSILVGSALFAAGAYLGNWTPAEPAWLGHPGFINTVFFIGSVFFTAAGYLQFLEAVNGDVADIHGDKAGTWRWFGWKPHNPGYAASVAQLAGTVLFNFDTADSMIVGLSAEATDVLVWRPTFWGASASSSRVCSRMSNTGTGVWRLRRAISRGGSSRST